VVVPKQPAQTLTAADLAFFLPGGTLRHDQLVAETLVIPFSVVVGDELLNGTSQMALPEENHLGQT